MDCSSPLDYEFTAFMNDAESYAWKINGTDVTGDDTLIYSFGSTGDYLVELTAGNLTTGCTITKSKVIPVRSITADFSAEPVVCMGNSIEFDASGSADYIETCYVEGFLWDFGDNTRPERTYYEQHAHSFYETGIFEVQLITTALNGCTDTIKRAVEVVQPSADFTVFPSSGCGPSLPVTFNYSGYSSDIDNWTWVFGDLITDDTQVLNPTHSYIAPVSQVFLATLFVEDIYGCTNNLTQPVQVNTPVVDFYAIHSGICAGDEAQFVIATPGVNNYSWDYGDSTGTGMSDTHVYTDPGNYTVELTVEVEGCQRSITRNDYMSVEIADASFMPGDSVFTCYPAVTGFTYTGNSSSIASGRWTFEPGIQSPSYAPNTTYTYTTPGIYLSSLTIVTHNGCTDTQYHTIEVTGPDADYEFSPSFICSGDTVLFRINEMDGVEDFLWVFGDGSTSELQEPEHVYTARGELYPSLILINGECEVTLSEYSLYVSTIRADFEMQPEQDFYCYNGPVHARNNSEDYSSSVWRINGIQVAGSNHLNSSFPLLGENTLTLEVYNALGCSDTLERIYTAIDPPDFSITGDSTVCQNGDLARLHIPEPEDEWTVLWEPGSSIMSPDRFLLNISPDTTTLYTATVTDEWGCVNSHSFLVRVIEPSAIERIPLQDTSIYIGESIMLLINTFNEGSEYAWSPDDHITCTHCNDPLVNPLEDVTYTCRVIDECLDITLEFPVEVIIDFYLELPTAFSPNDDGVNDIFRMEYHNVGEVDFRIFNRWGNLMFSTQDPEEGWDGRSSGKLQNPDSYAYVIRARTIHGYEFERKGTFLLLR